MPWGDTFRQLVGELSSADLDACDLLQIDDLVNALRKIQARRDRVNLSAGAVEPSSQLSHCNADGPTGGASQLVPASAQCIHLSVAPSPANTECIDPPRQLTAMLDFPPTPTLDFWLASDTHGTATAPPPPLPTPHIPVIDWPTVEDALLRRLCEKSVKGLSGGAIVMPPPASSSSLASSSLDLLSRTLLSATSAIPPLKAHSGAASATLCVSVVAVVASQKETAACDAVRMELPLTRGASAAPAGASISNVGSCSVWCAVHDMLAEGPKWAAPSVVGSPVFGGSWAPVAAAREVARVVGRIRSALAKVVGKGGEGNGGGSDVGDAGGGVADDSVALVWCVRYGVYGSSASVASECSPARDSLLLSAGVGRRLCDPHIGSAAAAYVGTRLAPTVQQYFRSFAGGPASAARGAAKANLLAACLLSVFGGVVDSCVAGGAVRSLGETTATATSLPPEQQGRAARYSSSGAYITVVVGTTTPVVCHGGGNGVADGAGVGGLRGDLADGVRVVEELQDAASSRSALRPGGGAVLKRCSCGTGLISAQNGGEGVGGGRGALVSERAPSPAMPPRLSRYCGGVLCDGRASRSVVRTLGREFPVLSVSAVGVEGRLHEENKAQMFFCESKKGRVRVRVGGDVDGALRAVVEWGGVDCAVSQVEGAVVGTQYDYVSFLSEGSPEGEGDGVAGGAFGGYVSGRGAGGGDVLAFCREVGDGDGEVERVGKDGCMVRETVVDAAVVVVVQPRGGCGTQSMKRAGEVADTHVVEADGRCVEARVHLACVEVFRRGTASLFSTACASLLGYASSQPSACDEYRISYTVLRPESEGEAGEGGEAEGAEVRSWKECWCSVLGTSNIAVA